MTPTGASWPRFSPVIVSKDQGALRRHRLRAVKAGLGIAAADQMIGFFKLGHLADVSAGGLSYGQQKLLDAAMAFMAGPASCCSTQNSS